MLALLPESAQKDDIFLRYYHDLKEVYGHLTLGNEHWNTRWNRCYGDGARKWKGLDQDGLAACHIFVRGLGEVYIV